MLIILIFCSLIVLQASNIAAQLSETFFTWFVHQALSLAHGVT